NDQKSSVIVSCAAPCRAEPRGENQTGGCLGFVQATERRDGCRRVIGIEVCVKGVPRLKPSRRLLPAVSIHKQLVRCLTIRKSYSETLLEVPLDAAAINVVIPGDQHEAAPG